MPIKNDFFDNSLDIKCPFCNVSNSKYTKKWKFGVYDVYRFQCKCGKFFNYYKSEKMSWTIPKSKNN